VTQDCFYVLFPHMGIDRIHNTILTLYNCLFYFKTKTNSVALSPQENYTDSVTATYRRNLLPTFVGRGVSCGQRGGSPAVVNLSFLDGSRYFSLK
jgi:hypothetical protein